jgi:CRISPR-associated protein Csm5
MNYHLTTLTPTLVGDGTRLSPIDYMVWRDQINVLHQTRIFKLLSKGPRLEGYLTQLRKATKLDFASWGGFAQNYADRRIPFEDPAYTPVWNGAPPDALSIPTFAAGESGPFIPGTALKGALRTAFVFSRLKPGAIKDLGEKLTGDKLPRKPAENLESNAAGSGGSDRLRAVSLSDSSHSAYDAFKIYLLRLSTLTAGKGPQKYALGWKPTPAFAEMAAPGTTFTGTWRENDFLNREEVRQMLRWNQPVTHATLFDAANQYAAKQLEIHAQYAEWTGLETLAASIAALRQKLEDARNNGACLLAIGWGAGFLSKSAAIGADDADNRKVLALLPYYNRAIQTGLPFPKTRRVVFLKNKPATLPGWVELRVS